MPPARMTARASETISRKDVEGSRSMKRRVMESGVAGSSDLVKKRRPSSEGWVSANKSEETWWRTGVAVVNFVGMFEKIIVDWESELFWLADSAWPAWAA